MIGSFVCYTYSAYFLHVSQLHRNSHTSNSVGRCCSVETKAQPCNVLSCEQAGARATGSDKRLRCPARCLQMNEEHTGAIMKSNYQLWLPPLSCPEFDSSRYVGVRPPSTSAFHIRGSGLPSYLPRSCSQPTFSVKKWPANKRDTGLRVLVPSYTATNCALQPHPA